MDDIQDLSSAGAECLGRLEVNKPNAPAGPDAIRLAMRAPLWSKESGTEVADDVLDRVAPGEQVCIVVSDHTRRTAADRVAQVLVDGLETRGCSVDDMHILFASGIHRHPTEQEVTAILGTGTAERFKGRIRFHDPDDPSELVSVGRTSRGHEVKLNRLAAEAERLVLTGGVLYHYHAGFGGGRKSLVPGLAGRATIAHNHSLTLDPAEDRMAHGVGPGQLDGNPVAMEMMEAACLRPPDFIINTVLGPGGEIAGVFAGDMVAAHRAACDLAAEIYKVQLRERSDFVIALAGKARNWIQSHKALYNASRAVRPGGRIILDAPCPEGIGDERFRYWVTRPTVGEIYAGLRGDPEILGQTALSTRLRGERAVLVTSMPVEDSADLGIAVAGSLDEATQQVIAELRREGIARPTCYLMPDALYTVPFG